MKVNGTWVRKYVLGYSTGDNGYTTLLSSIAEIGRKASGTVVSLPSSTFSYQDQISGWMTLPRGIRHDLIDLADNGSELKR